jgi:hypothetical protein
LVRSNLNLVSHPTCYHHTIEINPSLGIGILNLVARRSSSNRSLLEELVLQQVARMSQMSQQTYLPLLPIKVPVPSDIEIAQSVAPVPVSRSTTSCDSRRYSDTGLFNPQITRIASSLGLQDDEYEIHGIHKAKVRWTESYQS